MERVKEMREGRRDGGRERKREGGGGEREGEREKDECRRHHAI